jgi:hypothetical protein
MRYLSIAMALVLLSGVAQAAGKFDGQWIGGWSGVSSIGGEQPGLCQSYRGNVHITISDGRVSGETTGQYQGTITGTVQDDGKFSGKMASYDMGGKFSGKKFTGRFVTAKCAMSVTAKSKSG